MPVLVFAQHLKNLAAIQRQVFRLVDDVKTRRRLEDEYAQRLKALDTLRRELPDETRSDDQLVCWPTEVTRASLKGLIDRWEMLNRPAVGLWQRILFWIQTKQRKRELDGLTQAFQKLPVPNRTSWNAKECFAVWLAWADAAVAFEAVCTWEKQLRGQRDPELVSADLRASVSCGATVAAAILKRLSAGHGFALKPEEREAMSNLRAGIANLGEKRWGRVFREQFPTVLKAFPLWAVSSLSAKSALPLTPGVFDLVIIDEASQCDIASTIPLLARAKRVAIVGDPRQLTHVSTLTPSAERNLLEAHGITALDVQRFTYRENSCFDLANSSQTVTAQTFMRRHYRCHPDIADFASAAFYQDALDVVTATERLRIPTGKTAGLHWTHVSGQIVPGTTGAICREEISTILQELLHLQEKGYNGTIGIVTPFKQQMIRLLDEIPSQLSPKFRDETRLLIATAHGFQGDERDLMYMSLCCGPEMPEGALRFVAENRNLFNVAVTRARAVLHIVGNLEWARSSQVSFIQACAKRCGAAAETAPAPAEDLYESPWERTLAQALREAGLETIPQYRIAGRRLDLAILNPIKIDIEVDGEHHRTAGGARKDDDNWRDLQIESLGWKVCRFWVYQLREDLPGCVNKIAKLRESG